MGYDDDDSINTIVEKLTEQVNNVTRAHNANSVVTSEGIAASRLKASSNAKKLPS